MNKLSIDKLAAEIAEVKPPERTDIYRPRPQYTPIQIIAHAITNLRWLEAEAMAKAVAEATGEGKSMALAIQEWARGWEEFKP